jgi:hypothetical protein
MDGIEYGAAADMPAAIAARELLPGERLQWAARPQLWAVARQKLRLLVGAVFLLAIGGAAIDLGSGVVLTSGGPLSALPVAGIGALFVLLGIAFAGAPLAAAWQARGTVYAVTTRRLLVIDRVFIHRVAAFAPEEIQAVMVTNERPDGSADIVFRQHIRHVRVRGARIGIVDKIGFFGIADPERVRDLIRGMRGDVTNAPTFLTA